MVGGFCVADTNRWPTGLRMATGALSSLRPGGLMLGVERSIDYSVNRGYSTRTASPLCTDALITPIGLPHQYVPHCTEIGWFHYTCSNASRLCGRRGLQGLQQGEEIARVQAQSQQLQLATGWMPCFSLHRSAVRLTSLCARCDIVVDDIDDWRGHLPRVYTDTLTRFYWSQKRFRSCSPKWSHSRLCNWVLSNRRSSFDPLS